MNILYLKYAVEVAKAGSINKAAETLFVAQPNLSRAIKDIEAELGIVIFNRTAKGMTLTNDGKEFMNYANQVLSQIDTFENIYKQKRVIQKFSAFVPRSAYISDAFARFSNRIDLAKTEIIYRETSTWTAIDTILERNYNLGIVRYTKDNDEFFKNMITKKDLSFIEIASFTYTVAMNKDCPLAKKKVLTLADLSDYAEILPADPSESTRNNTTDYHISYTKKENNGIFVFERANQLDLLSTNKNVFMQVSPIPPNTLERYGIVQRICPEFDAIYNDVLIYRNDYKLTKTDQLFIDCLNEAKPSNYMK